MCRGKRDYRCLHNYAISTDENQNSSLLLCSLVTVPLPPSSTSLLPIYPMDYTAAKYLFTLLSCCLVEELPQSNFQSNIHIKQVFPKWVGLPIQNCLSTQDNRSKKDQKSSHTTILTLLSK